MTTQHANMHVCMHVPPETASNCIRSLIVLANPNENEPNIGATPTQNGRTRVK